MKTHHLKTWPEPFFAVAAGTKTHEVRKNDRSFAAGDRLLLQEWRPEANHPDGGSFTGRELLRTISYVTPGGEWGLPADICVLSIAALTPTLRQTDPNADPVYRAEQCDYCEAESGEACTPGCDALEFNTDGPVVHACAVDFPEVESDAIDNLCGALGLMAEQLSGNLEEVTCPECLRAIARWGQAQGQATCGLALALGRQVASLDTDRDRLALAYGNMVAHAAELRQALDPLVRMSRFGDFAYPESVVDSFPVIKRSLHGPNGTEHLLLTVGDLRRAVRVLGDSLTRREDPRDG